MKTSLIAATLFCLFTQAALADTATVDPFQKGAALYDEGNFEEAKEILSPLADRDDPRALFVFGLMHEFGKGFTADARKAKDFYERAAKDRVPGAMNQLGLMYLNGKGGLSDKKKAWDLFKRGASLGNATSAFNAARAVYWASPELFTEQLLAEALKFAEQARNQGMDADFLENTLTCALQPPRKSGNDFSIRESLAHYEATGPVKTIVDMGSPSNGTMYFGRGGHLLRDETQIGEWFFGYDPQCRLVSTEWVEERNGQRRTVGKRTTTYNGQDAATFRQEGVFPVDLRYSHYDQRDGGRVTKSEQVGQTYPMTSFRKLDANGRLIWDTNNALKPSPWSIVIPNPKMTGSPPRPDGDLYDMGLAGGSHFLYTPEGRLATIIDNNGAPSGRYWMRIDYRHSKEGWVVSEQLSSPNSSDRDWMHTSIWSAEFTNYKGDKRGNWISRKAKYRFASNDFTRDANDEQYRQITYYGEQSTPVARKK